MAFAGPPLTTVQDVLYKADGTRFNGTLTIAWTSFQASDTSAVVTQSTTVKVVDGNLRVQLVPSTTATPPIAYSVTYNSDGRVQFRESWAIPASARAVRLRDVRVASPAAGSIGSDTAPTSVQESDVVGLVADLGARPLKGTAFAAGRVAMVNSSGMLDAVSGSATDCVRVDGSSGPCGDANLQSFVDGDSPAGIVDGANPVFTLSAAPDPLSSLAVYRNGLLQKVGQDYNIEGRSLTFVSAAIPQPGDTLLASYRLNGGDTGSSRLYSTPQVLCNGIGPTISATTLTTFLPCALDPGLLAAGDRLQLSVEVEHQGVAGGFSFEVDWGGTVVVHRDAAASETRATVRADATILPEGAGLSAQSWGSSLPFQVTAAKSLNAWSSGLDVNFKGSVGSPSDTLKLTSYTVVRYH